MLALRSQAAMPVEFTVVLSPAAAVAVRLVAG